MRKENNNFKNSLELSFNGATLKLENYDPKHFDKIFLLIVYIIAVVAFVVVTTIKA